MAAIQTCLFLCRKASVWKGKSRRHVVDDSAQKQTVDIYLKKDKLHVASGEFATNLCRQLEENRARMSGQSTSELWSCGQNSYGELCHDDMMSRHELSCAHFMNDMDIAQIAAGKTRCLITCFSFWLLRK